MATALDQLAVSLGRQEAHQQETNALLCQLVQQGRAPEQVIAAAPVAVEEHRLPAPCGPAA